MSRIGNKQIVLPAGVEVIVNDATITVKGPKGELTKTFENCIEVKQEENVLTFVAKNNLKHTHQMHGTTRAIVANMVKGVTEGYSKSVTISGVGYKCAVQGNKIVLNIGFSHPVNIAIPQGLTATCPSATEIVISGIDKTAVGQFAADIKALKKVEPYHGYGIYYTNEPVRRKEIKKGKKK